MAQSLQCISLVTPTRRAFWTTKLDSCETTSCDRFTCGNPGLALETSDEGGRFETDDWVRSTALNMLLTDARRRATSCGNAPGTLNGHWSENFIGQGREIGTHVRYIDPRTSVRDAVLLIKAEVRATLQKLIDYGIAVEITVEAVYQGNGLIDMDIEIIGSAVNPTRLNVSAKRSENSWAWVS